MTHRLVLGGLVTLLLGCGERTSPPGEWQQEDGYRWRELAAPARGPAGFERMPARSTGIDFQNTVSDSLLVGNRMLAQGAGVCLGDVDGDGMVDIFLARTEGPNALYRNLGNWRFEEIAEAAGVDAPDRYSTGCALADINGNGHLDLVLVSTLGPNSLFLNDGTGRFTEHGADLGLDITGKGGTTIAMADVDGDGWLDLYVANYKQFHPADSFPPQQRAPNQLVREVSPGTYRVIDEFAEDFKLVMRPDMGGLNLTMRADPDDFYRNEGGRFTRIPLPSDRFLDAAGQPLDPAPESFTLGARFADFNGDGAPDLYVANDFEDPDLFWLNDGAGGFRLAPWQVQRQNSHSAMGVDVADIDGDGHPDFFVTDMLSQDTRRLRTQIPTHTSLPKRPGEIEMQLQWQRNTLLLNRGDGTFSEIGQAAGVAASGWSWGTMFMDVDLDGRPDILVATGHPWDIMDADTQERLQNRLTGVPWQRHRWEYPELPLPNVAFRNRGDLTFEDASTAWGFAQGDDISHALAAADLDGDGALDVVVNRLGAQAVVLRGRASAPRLTVRLVGDAPNTRAVGARIRVLGGAVPVQVREVAVGGLYLSHSDYLASFATGDADSVTIEVTWRDGRRSMIAGARPGREYEITNAAPPAPPAAEADGAGPTLFEDVSALLGGHRHTENLPTDWDRQFMLPNALSQMGPGVAWFDLDRNGSEDLIIGTGQGGRLAVFRNTAGRLVPSDGSAPVASRDLTTVLGVADERGARILAGVSAWEAANPAELAEQAPVVSLSAEGGRLGGTFDEVVRPTASAVGPVAIGDYTGDGQLDLFVGGRAVPGRYPAAATSLIFRNEGGRYLPDPGNSALLREIGMVSAAVFADLNGDGHADLLLAQEWGPLVLLLNDGQGRFRRAPEAWGLAEWTSRWNGVTVGDLDGDGRLDIVATSWGRNLPHGASREHPLQIVHGTIGSRGEDAMILGRHDARLGVVAPLNSYPRVRQGIAGIPDRVQTFHEYAEASLDQVLGPEASQLRRLSVVTLEHAVFLNRGDRFEAVPLPATAQLAPAHYAGVADFTGDGHEDLFLSQNFFPTDIGTPRLDGGRGLLLRGDGTGALHPVPGAESGILVYGDQRGAAFADFDGDGRLDLVVTQNGAETRLFQNRGATPGLRVRLAGPPGNPDGVGAQVRVVYGAEMGPVREVLAGSGYWSQNGAVQVMGLSGIPTEIWVRWPGGQEGRVPVPAGAREVVVR